MIIDGKSISEKILMAAKERVSQASQKPGLAVMIVGDNAASAVYVRNKVNACNKTGIISTHIELPAETSEAVVLDKISQLNNDPTVHGILVQLPLPAHINSQLVLEAIIPEKDVDGFHAINMGKLVADIPALRPCTPHGCMTLLREANTSIKGANAVILGRSHIVGKPMALMLINAGATVTVCNSKTKNLAAIASKADILVAAVGIANMVTADMIMPGATIIDVGINRLPEGGITGDVDFNQAKNIAGAITPVPGGVGPMTIATLITNTLQAAGL